PDTAQLGIAKKGKSETYNPRSGRGRRKASTIGGTDRQVFMREQQRAFRDRKQKYLASLEEKCKALEAEVRELRAAAVKLDSSPADFSSSCSTSATISNQSQAGETNTAAKLETNEAEKIFGEMEAVMCLNPVCAAQTAILRTHIAQLQLQLANTLLTSAPITNISANLNSSSSPQPKNPLPQSLPNILSQNNEQLFDNSNVLGLHHSDSVSSFIDSDFDWLMNDVGDVTGMPRSNLESAIPASIMTSSSFEQRCTMPSSEQLYGPALTDEFKNKLKCIKSLQTNTKVVDRMCDIYIRLTRTTDTKTARVLFLRMVREMNRLTDLCTVVERVEVIEIFSEFYTLNSIHDTHLHSLMNRFQTIQEPIIPTNAEWSPKIQKFREDLRRIPSLVNLSPEAIDPLIDRMCLIWGYSEKRDINPEEFFQMNNTCHGLLILMLNKEDRTKFFMSVELLKSALWREMDEILAGIEA
ncbi:hypothetical protein HK100_009019, partial [Physocladia obscura]